MATTSDIKNGVVLAFNNDLYSVIEFQHVKPGKGPAFVRTKLKSIRTGKVLDNTFSAGHKIVTARVERHPYQFLYKDSTGYHFMHTSTYEQIILEKHLINTPEFLHDGQLVEVLLHTDENQILGCEVPKQIKMKIIRADPGVRGNTATNATKSAEIESGVSLQVPLFINEGDTIKINTENSTYIERVK